MVVVPSAIAVTKPPALTVATALLLLLHTPPAMVLLSCVVAPAHTIKLPVILALGAVYVAQVPETCPATQFEVVPVKAKPVNVPVLLFPLASTNVFTLLLLTLIEPWLNL